MESIIKNNKNTTDLCNKLKYIEKQYKPLTKKEERALIEKYKDNREELNKLLFMHNVRMVFNVAKKYVSKTNDFDNLVMDGMLGLAEATNRFDISKNIKFITYATIWIRKYILMNFYGKQLKIDKNSMSLDTAISTILKGNSNSNNDATFENIVNTAIDPSYKYEKTIDEQLSSNEQHLIYNDLISYVHNDSNLSSLDKNVFIDMFQNGEKLKTISEKYSISKQDVNNIKNKILSKMKNILHNKYYVDSCHDLMFS